MAIPEGNQELHEKTLKNIIVRYNEVFYGDHPYECGVD